MFRSNIICYWVKYTKRIAIVDLLYFTRQCSYTFNVRWEIWHEPCCKCTAEYNGERIFTIGQQFLKLLTGTFLWLTVYNRCADRDIICMVEICQCIVLSHAVLVHNIARPWYAHRNSRHVYAEWRFRLILMSAADGDATCRQERCCLRHDTTYHLSPVCITSNTFSLQVFSLFNIVRFSYWSRPS